MKAVMVRDDSEEFVLYELTVNWPFENIQSTKTYIIVDARVILSLCEVVEFAEDQPSSFFRAKGSPSGPGPYEFSIDGIRELGLVDVIRVRKTE